MNYEAYMELFKKLGFRDIELRKALKHQNPIPTIYFNRKRDGFIYFTVHAKDRAAFKGTLWQFIEAQQKKDQDPRLRTVVPTAGNERQAFLDVADRKGAPRQQRTTRLPNESPQPTINPIRGLPAAEPPRYTSRGRHEVFNSAKAVIPAELLPLSGKVFYSGRNAFSRPATVYMLGANPGGDPDSESENSIAADTHWVATDAPVDWSAYRDESWKGKPPGTHGMQPRVLHMFKAVGLEAGDVPASNLVFQRSRREADLSGFEHLAHACWPFHQYVLDSLRPKVVVCLGKTAGTYVCRKVGAHRLMETFTERNDRRWQSEWYRAPNGLSVVVVTHPSIANWCNPVTDPTGLITKAMQNG